MNGTGELSTARRLWELYRIFFMISLTTVGGGLAMLPIIQAELTVKRTWLTQEEMVDCIALTQSMPGIIGGNIAAGTGYFIAGAPGAIAAVFGMLCPPFLSILIIAICFTAIPDVEWLQNAFAGIRAGVCALILCSAVKLGKQILKKPLYIILAAVSFLLLTFFPKNSVILLILASGFIAWILEFVQSKGQGAQK